MGGHSAGGGLREESGFRESSGVEGGSGAAAMGEGTKRRRCDTAGVRRGAAAASEGGAKVPLKDLDPTQRSFGDVTPGERASLPGQR